LCACAYAHARERARKREQELKEDKKDALQMPFDALFLRASTRNILQHTATHNTNATHCNTLHKRACARVRERGVFSKERASVSNEQLPFWSVIWALLNVCRALLSVYRALLSVYRALLNNLSSTLTTPCGIQSSVLQCIVVCCSAVQCGAVWCSVL